MLDILREHWEDMKLELAEYLCLECSRCRNRSPQHFELQGIMDDGEAGLFLRTLFGLQQPKRRWRHPVLPALRMVRW